MRLSTIRNSVYTSQKEADFSMLENTALTQFSLNEFFFKAYFLVELSG
jgi:hypothetical protein